MNLQLTRKTYTTRSTIGELLVDGKFQCYVLEDPVRPEKIKGITAIPAGSYQIAVTWSPKFKQEMPLLEDVPDFEGIRIHPGNSPEHTEGCLLVGKSRATDSIGTSREAYQELFQLLKTRSQSGGKIRIHIIEGGTSPYLDEPETTTSTKGSAYRVTADPLRIRSSPDSSDLSTIIGRLPFGLIVFAKGGTAPAGWIKVEARLDDQKIEGFVSTLHLEAIPVAIAVAETEIALDLFRVTASILHLRKETSSSDDASIIARLPANHLVKKIAASATGMWWEVSTVLHGETLKGFVNSGFLTADDPALSSTTQSLPPSGKITLTEKALDFILGFEGMDQPSIWPGQQSGISLGHGYDLGYYSRDEFMGDWSSHLPSAQLNRLLAAIGKTGTAAKAIAPNFKDIKISAAAADAVFMNNTIPKIKLWAIKTFPGILELPADTQGALVSLVYNRGTEMEGDRRRELRDIRDTTADRSLSTAEKLIFIARALRSMKRIWPSGDPKSGHPGIRRRREAEAVMVETSDLTTPAPKRSKSRGGPAALAARKNAPEKPAPPSMVAEFLDRADTLDQIKAQRKWLKSVQKDIVKKDKPTLAELKKHQITPAQIKRAIAALDDAITKAKYDKSHPQGSAYIPSDPISCNLQAGLTHIAIAHNKVQEKISPPVTIAASHARSRSGARPQTDTSAPLRLRKTREAFIEGNPLHHGDPLYAWDGFKAKFGALFTKRHPFNPNPARIASTTKPLTLFLFGDWGTGLPLAAEVTKRISEQLAHTPASRQQHVIHLGDVYYVGDAEEYEKRVIPHWPAQATKDKTIGSWSLNGNHDMYSGGQGYFQTLLARDFMIRWHGDKNGKASSFFLIENKDWQIFGLDTSWNLPSLGGTLFGKPTAKDYGGQNGILTKEQVQWMAAKRDTTKGAILLTHHQPASSRKEKANNQGATHSDQAVALMQDHGVYPTLDAWIWGHEHRCVVFEPKAKRSVPRLKDAPHFCACLGTSGVPVTEKNFKATEANTDVLWQEKRFNTTTYEGLPVLPFAFARIDTDPGKFAFTIFDHTGNKCQSYTVTRPRS